MENINYEKIDNHPKGAVRFFKIMMRLEYALKACGFAEMNGAKLEILWDKYAKDRLSKEYFEIVRDSGIAKTLIDNPPSRQSLSENLEVKFPPAAHVTCTQELLGAVLRTRNNLFHGGKSGDVDHDRNDTLIAEAIAVVEEILKSDKDLRAEFEGRY